VRTTLPALYPSTECGTSDEMLPPKRKEGIVCVAAVGAVVYDVFVAPPAQTAGLKITGKAHAAARDAAYGPAPVAFETPSLAFESRFQVRFGSVFFIIAPGPTHSRPPPPPFPYPSIFSSVRKPVARCSCG
jgi:hypothetical protein